MEFHASSSTTLNFFAILVFQIFNKAKIVFSEFVIFVGIEKRVKMLRHYSKPLEHVLGSLSLSGPAWSASKTTAPFSGIIYMSVHYFEDIFDSKIKSLFRV